MDVELTNEAKPVQSVQRQALEKTANMLTPKGHKLAFTSMIAIYVPDSVLVKQDNAQVAHQVFCPENVSEALVSFAVADHARDISTRIFGRKSKATRDSLDKRYNLNEKV